MTGKIPIKRESDTRWSARESAVRMIAESFGDLIELLQHMTEDTSESKDTRRKAGILLTFYFVCFVHQSQRL